MAELVEYQNLIGGGLLTAASGRLLDAVNPATGEVFARIPAGDRTDVEAAVAAARGAFPAWAALTADQRAGYLRKVAAIFAEHGEDLARLEALDSGRIVRENVPRMGPGMAYMWTLAAGQVLEAVTGQSVVLGPNSLGLTRREPYGVVAAIIPWNAPISMLSAKAAFALAAGNTVVVKPAEQASVSVLRLGELLREVLPPGVLNIVSGFGPEAGDALVRHRGVGRITMTGSSETGRAVQRAAADTLTPSIFELGGKSPNIVFADADLDAAANGVTLASVFTGNAGQLCLAGSRILVQRPVLEEMLGRIRAIAAKVVLGDPLETTTTMGPLVSAEQYDRVVGFLESGAKEAQLVFGGRHGAGLVPSMPGGYWVEPTLFRTEDNSLRICQEEIFGPVAVVIPFDTDEEALAIANDTRYGLAAGLWTRDLARVHRFVRDLESGNVWVNTYPQTGLELPFGGVKDSGYGHDRILEFTREKSAIIAT
jgi:aldehyde dehydrogenase (NAD+)